MAGEHASPEFIEAVRVKWGLDRPLYTQYFIWFRSVLQGDFGTSIATHTPVLEELLQRFPATLELSLFATIFAVPVGDDSRNNLSSVTALDFRLPRHGEL